MSLKSPLNTIELKKLIEKEVGFLAIAFSKLIHPFDISSQKNKEPTPQDFNNAFEKLSNCFNDYWIDIKKLSKTDHVLKKNELEVFIIFTVLKSFIDDPIIDEETILKISKIYLDDINTSGVLLENLKNAQKKLSGTLFSEFLYSNAYVVSQEITDIIALTLLLDKRNRSLYSIEELETPSYFSLALSKVIKSFKKELFAKHLEEAKTKGFLTNETFEISSKDQIFKALLNEHYLKDLVPYIIDDEAWPTVSHYYQVQKFTHYPNYPKIKQDLLELHAEKLQDYVNNNHLQTFNDWYPIKPEDDISSKNLFEQALDNKLGKSFFVMAKALKEKFSHPYERSLLLKTDDWILKIDFNQEINLKGSQKQDPFDSNHLVKEQINYLGKMLEGLRALIKEGIL
jgi:hypothetical protein